MDIDGDDTSVFLEGSCGHEFEWPKDRIAPSEGICSEHGLTSLWAQRNEPKGDLPRGTFG